MVNLLNFQDLVFNKEYTNVVAHFSRFSAFLAPFRVHKFNISAMISKICNGFRKGHKHYLNVFAAMKLLNSGVPDLVWYVHVALASHAPED